jgi:hypothetical protein
MKSVGLIVVGYKNNAILPEQWESGECGASDHQISQQEGRGRQAGRQAGWRGEWRAGRVCELFDTFLLMWFSQYSSQSPLVIISITIHITSLSID